MALHFLHAETPYGAADSQVAWFAALEDWLVNTVGWTVASGAGSTDIVFTSAGESGLLTMLFVHIWAVGNLVYADVQDDQPGTHKTTQLDALAVPTAQIVEYWFTADLDTIVMVVPYTGTERLKYLGLLKPLALNPANETYYMVASSNRIGTAAILRDHTGAWDVNITNRTRAESDNITRTPVNGEFGAYSLYADRYDACAGQYKYMSTGLGLFSIGPRDKETSNFAGATSEWECFFDGISLFMLQTAGVAPGDSADGAHFAYRTGVEANPGNFITVSLPDFMTGIGWDDLGPAGEWTIDRLFHSHGENGQRDIYIVFGYEISGNPYWWLRAYDDALGTHKTQFGATEYKGGSWPGTYHMAADRDCLCMAWVDVLGRDAPQWLGMCEPFYPGIADSDYLTGIWSEFLPSCSVLRGHGGNWGAGAGAYDGGAVGDLSSPNLYDGTTYPLWPFVMASSLGGAGTPQAASGWMKYLMHVAGAPLAVNDTITIGAERYLVLRRTNAPNLWAMRIS